MAIQIKDAATLADKYATRAAGASGDYKKGVQQPRRPWAASTTAAADTWGQGVTAAVSNGSFARGVNKAGDQKWQSNAADKGASRYPQGVAAGKSNWATNIQPSLNIISNANLPPRGPKGSPQNLERVRVIADALRAGKIGK